MLDYYNGFASVAQIKQGRQLGGRRRHCKPISRPSETDLVVTTVSEVSPPRKPSLTAKPETTIVQLAGRCDLSVGRKTRVPPPPPPKPAKRPSAAPRPRQRSSCHQTAAHAPARRASRSSCHGRTGPPAEGDPDPARRSRHLHLVIDNPRQQLERLLYHRRLRVMIGDPNFGRAGPFVITEKDFHDLCAAARELETRRRA